MIFTVYSPFLYYHTDLRKSNDFPVFFKRLLLQNRIRVAIYLPTYRLLRELIILMPLRAITTPHLTFSSNQQGHYQFLSAALLFQKSKLLALDIQLSHKQLLCTC